MSFQHLENNTPNDISVAVQFKKLPKEVQWYLFIKDLWIYDTSLIKTLHACLLSQLHREMH